jgi:uncharacterized membrane protein YedE/YeeE
MSATIEPVLADEQPIIAATPGRSFAAVGETPVSLVLYLLIGIAFGIVLTKGEVVSWFRIQEMFRLQSFHMYGTIGSAVPVAALSLWLIRRRGVRGRDGALLRVPPKESTPGLRRYWMGGTVFGFGWALLGACPGPIFSLIGSGVTVMVVALVAALLGTWAYAWLRPVLPH